MVDFEGKINAWKPSTTQCLLHPTRTILACDVLDHSMGLSFLKSLNLEIEERGITKKVEESKTTMDLFRSDNTFIGKIRGDLSVVIPRSFRSTDEFKTKYRFLHMLIKSVETTAKFHLSQNDGGRSFIDIDTSMTSVQFAVYPGDAVSGYARHCDLGPDCNHDPLSPKVNTDSQRIITAIYYLNEVDWSEDDGGCLKIFGKEDDSSHCIVPYGDRLVVFRSDLVEHQVFPSNKRSRRAITIWLYGHIVLRNEHRIQTKSIHKSSNMVPLPLPNVITHQMSHDTIFVSIPAYRDTETIPTILSLFENASNSERIFIGVVFQFNSTSQVEYDMYFNLEALPTNLRQQHIRTIILDYRDATGPCYARFLAQSLHRGEEYVLQIDSHMRFRPNWDSYLIGALNRCESPQKSVLTAYPPPYYLPNDIPNETRPSLLVPWKFDENGLLRQKGRLLIPLENDSHDESNIPCLLFAGGFNFSTKASLKDCPYDGTMHHLFFGEELSMAIRMYTNGYDLYTPPQSVCYHLWSREHRTTFQDDFKVVVVDKEDERVEPSDDILRQRLDSQEKVHRQLRGECTEQMGSVRSISSFSTALGVNFHTRMMNQDACKGGLDESRFVNHESDRAFDNNTLKDVLALVQSVMKL
jgi:[Skp1-protein]-hydroxyproline N-acetylglucosaminyltransferase